MTDGSDFDGVVVFQIEEDPVIAAAETEAGERRLQFFDITGTATGQAGHVFNVVNLDGVVYFLDGQAGTLAQTAGYDTYLFVRTN